MVELGVDELVVVVDFEFLVVFVDEVVKVAGVVVVIVVAVLYVVISMVVTMVEDDVELLLVLEILVVKLTVLSADFVANTPIPPW